MKHGVYYNNDNNTICAHGQLELSGTWPWQNSLSLSLHFSAVITGGLG